MMFRLMKSILLLGLFAVGVRAEIPLEEKIGQILMTGFRGETVEAGSSIARDLSEYHLGGVILFDVDMGLGVPRRNIESPEQLARLTASLKSFSVAPLLIAIDQEGGRVNRLTEQLGFPPTVSHKELGERDDAQWTYQQSAQLAGALKAAGINLNLAPVVDLNSTPGNFIAAKERTFSADPAVVIRNAEQFMRAHHDAGLLCTLKHFPGHGSSTSDSHLGMADVTDTWQAQELEPYKALCGQADVVMTAHVFLRSIDPDWPSTLSEKMISGVLRKQLGYQGVVMSDDLRMGAIANHYGFETALERALNAGVDVLLIANNTDYDPDMVPKAVATVLHLVETGRVPAARIDQAFERVRRLKKKLHGSDLVSAKKGHG